MNNNRAICSIAGIVLLTSWALWLGFDGILFMSAIAILSGLGGYVLMKEGQVMVPGLAEILKVLDRKREDEDDFLK